MNGKLFRLLRVSQSNNRLNVKLFRNRLNGKPKFVKISASSQRSSLSRFSRLLRSLANNRVNGSKCRFKPNSSRKGRIRKLRFRGRLRWRRTKFPSLKR